MSGKDDGASAQKNAMVSVVLPVYNESASLKELFSGLRTALSQTGSPYEIVAVDDGSSDDSFAVLSELAREDAHITVVRFKTNFGQTAALAAGIEKAQGSIIVSIDSDLENDPQDIPRLLAKLNEGYDVVCGWRQGRWQDAPLSRRLPSVMANRLISYLTGVPLHDYGCTLRAYRAELIKSVRLYGEMHRFIPAYAAWQGGTVAEIKVNHTPRRFGKSNYGFGRVFRVLLDLIVVVFMHRYMNRPMHFFGGCGFASLFVGVLAGVAAILLRLFNIRHIVDTPLPILSTLFIIVGIQLVLFGVVAEMLMRTYYESQERKPYVIKEVYTKA